MKTGEYFEHRKWRDQMNDQPLRCKITRVAKGTVYYRPHYGWHDDGTEWLGSPIYFHVDQAPRYVAKQTLPYGKAVTP